MCPDPVWNTIRCIDKRADWYSRKFNVFTDKRGSWGAKPAIGSLFKKYIVWLVLNIPQ